MFLGRGVVRDDEYPRDLPVLRQTVRHEQKRSILQNRGVDTSTGTQVSWYCHRQTQVREYHCLNELK